MSNLIGSLLVARPVLRDSFFGRSVVLILKHDEEGAFGLVLNRPAPEKDLPFPVYVGGPCKMEGLLMIHGHGDWADEEESDEKALEICPGVFLGTTAHFEKATQAESAADKFRIFIGYAGWGPKQLEGEMGEGAWVVKPANGDIIFETPVPDLWDKLAPPVLHDPSMN